MAGEDAMVHEANEALEAAVDDAIAACDGDLRAAVRALLVTLDATEREVATLKADVARIEVAVSEGYVRGKLRRPASG